MINLQKFILIAVLSVICQQQLCSEAKELEITDYMGYAGKAIQVGNALVNGAKDIYNMLQPKTTKESESDVKITPGMEQRLTDQIKQVSKKLDSFKVDMDNMKEEIIDKILNELPTEFTLRENLFGIYMRINQIEILYNKFIKYVTKPTKFRKETLMDFANHAISHDLNELPNVIETIHWMLIQTDVEAGESVLTMLSRSTQVPKKMCKRKQSLQQMLQNLYETIVYADIKAYTMIQVANHIIQFFNGGDNSGESELAHEEFETRVNSTLKQVKSAMATACRSVWNCDSNEHKQDVTYTKLNNLFQKYVINEVDLNIENTCTATCPDYKVSKAYGCYDRKICAKQRSCHGNLWDCEYKIDTRMYICPSNPGSDRRYEYIEYGNSQRYGPKGTCPSTSIKMNSWTRGTVSCSYCMCTCDDLGYENSDRYVNLMPTYADSENNFVVTGIRFKKSNHILHLQIQQGILLPNGLIDERTINWKHINEYKVNEPMPLTAGTLYGYVPKENIDYHVLEWKIKRALDRDDPVYQKKSAVNLDDLDFANNEQGNDHVVTGVKFSVNEIRASGYHLNLEIFMTPFDFDSGKLKRKKSVWYSTYKDFNGLERLVHKSQKVEVNLNNLDVPTNSGASSVPTSQTNQFLYFTTTSLDRDAGQNTIPFIDLQSVETIPHSPLSGAGIFHKSSPGSGGFLALKLFTYNQEPHMKLEK